MVTASHGSLVNALKLIVLAIILVPVMISLTEAANLTGTNATIVSFLPTLVLLGVAIKVISDSL